MRHNHEKPWPCLTCGYVMDSFSATDNQEVTPQEDDMSMCMNCGEIYVRRSASWELPTVDEVMSFPEELIQMIAKMKKHRATVITRDLAAAQDPSEKIAKQ